MRDRLLTDEATISKPQACVIVNMSLEKFNQRWTDYYQYNVRHVKTTNGVKMALIDVMRMAYPSASEQTAYMMALDYTYRLKDCRDRRRHNRGNGAKKKDEGAEL